MPDMWTCGRCAPDMWICGMHENGLPLSALWPGVHHSDSMRIEQHKQAIEW